MMKKNETVVMRAIALCFKPFLKPEEAFIYCNLGHTQFAKKCAEKGIYKNENGYYRKEDLDKMMGGSGPIDFSTIAAKMKI
ncbi:hypothetical protein KRR40_00290 [Niabella defluvii]|nr:hypothetical protein KRR40_00290 [Niabella sp. I65]